MSNPNLYPNPNLNLTLHSTPKPSLTKVLFCHCCFLWLCDILYKPVLNKWVYHVLFSLQGESAAFSLRWFKEWLPFLGWRTSKTSWRGYSWWVTDAAACVCCVCMSLCFAAVEENLPLCSCRVQLLQDVGSFQNNILGVNVIPKFSVMMPK